jgi:adenylate cyclase class IV
VQTDTFFRVPNGRLKLREFSDAPAELIYYERADTPGPAESHFERISVPDAAALRAVLAAALGEAGRVAKHRQLYWVGRTRVHLDTVEGLGDFLELEVVLRDDEPAESGATEAARLVGAFHLREDDLLKEAYVDLLRQKAPR